MKLRELLTERTLNAETLRQWLQQWVGKNYYTHVSPEEYLRIRVQPTQHNSPSGIYGYSLDQKFQQYRDPTELAREITNTGTGVPRNFISVLRPTPLNPLELDNYSQDQFEQDMMKVLEYIGVRQHQAPMQVYNELKTHWREEDEFDRWANDPNNIVDFVTSLTPSIARKTTSSRLGDQRDLISRAIFVNILGYDAIFDPPGQSAIFFYEYEPDQAVFLTRKSFQVINQMPIRDFWLLEPWKTAKSG